MLIEHASRSTEDKREIYKCVTAVNRMLQPAKSPYSQPTRSVTQPSRTARLVNPKSQRKSTLLVNSQRKQQ